MNFCDHILELETSQPRQLCCFQNLKFEKIAKNYKIKIFKNLFHSFFLHIGTQIMCVKFRENQGKTVGGVAI